MAQINPRTIKVPFQELDTIIHISDVHIRLFKRHKEYKEIFAALYDQIIHKGSMFANSVILFTGDLLHAKTDLSPEMVALASDFLNRLADIAPTLVVVGNHDLNLANTFRLDSLSPILENISHPDLYYLKDSGIYTVADTDLAVYSIIGDRKDWPKVRQCKSPNKVAILHAPVDAALTDTGFTVTSRHVSLETFNGYHMVLLGDIHRHQTLQEYEAANKKPCIVYAGSLIQQNHGEKLEGHGWLEWDVKKRSFTHHEVPNKYGFATLIIENGKIPDLSHIPENARLRVFVKDLDASKVKKIESILKKKFNLQEFIVNKMRDDQLQIGNQHHSTAMVDVQNVDVQNKLIEEYLTRHYAVVDSELMERIFEINKELNSKVALEDLSRNVRWRPLLFEFSNMFSYGEGNAIDFESMQGVHGLFSPNASGKTAAFDAFMFCLYDKTPRAFKASHIINNRKNRFRCQLKFEINGVEYGIRRVGIRKPNNDVKVDVDFWKIDDEGEQVSLNAEDRRATDAVIRRYVGTYEDFILTSLSVQNNNALFIDKSQSERKDLLSQFMGINIFDMLYNLALDEMKESKGALKRMSKEDFAQELVVAQAEIDRLQNDYTKYETDKDIIGVELTNIERDVSSLYESKVPLDLTETDISKLDRAAGDLGQTLSTLSERTIDIDRKRTRLQEQSGSLASTVTGLHGTTERYEKLVTAQHEFTSIVNELALLTRQLATSQTQLDHIVTQEFDPDCKFCVQNNGELVRHSKAIKQDLTQFHQRVGILEPRKQKLSLVLVDFDDVSADYTVEKEVLASLLLAERELFVHTAKLSELKSTITTKKGNLKDVEDKIKKYHQNIDQIKKNTIIDQKIEALEQKQNELLNELKTLDTKLRGLHGNLQVQKERKRSIFEQLGEMEEIETLIKAYEFYVAAIRRDGISYELISKIIPSIEAEINNLLSQIVDFTIALEVDGKNINGRIIYDDDRHWPLEMSSGMERFIGSLAIRVALITVSNLPKPNFLVVDEGLGVLSSENLISMQTMFAILKNQFDFIVIVSHLEAVRDMVDSLMEIQLDNGYSRINY
jgi:DNA repair exonuclease SbcCD ATPase subunit